MYHVHSHKIKRHTKRFVVYCFTAIALALSANNTVQAQSYNMVHGQTLYLDICMGGTTIYDDGGPDGSYSNSFSGQVVLTTNPGDTISLTGTYSTENNYDYITVYDNNTQIAYVSGAGTFNLQATSGSMRIVFTSDGSVTYEGFALTATTTAPLSQCNANISNVTVTDIGGTSATISWTSDSPSLMLDYGTGPFAVTGSSYTFTDLDANTPYTVNLYDQADSGEVCCTYTAHFRTSIQSSHGCVDPTDLTGAHTLGYYGFFSNPYLTEGIVNYGPSDAYSRHTIHTNTNERDPRTGNQLYTVPPGGTSSVRLGNWRTGSEAEALLYAIEVDTLISDLLILKYAAVLEDPNHPADEQPRFRLEVLNSSMEVIDTICGMADFIANANLGWNSYGSTLWKDWTTVGLDLAPYAGQTIFVRFTTYDCNRSGHYGYAYFTLECGRKRLTSTSCGNNTDNTFTAPDGFSYLWYTDTVTNPISTSQSLSFSTDSNTFYHCLLSFIDKPVCNFTMNAFAGARFPLALFDTIVTLNNCEYTVDFINRSTISNDGVNPSGSGESCETAWWDFGNGDTSSSYHASAHYDTPGTYTVTLVSTIANGLCADTLQQTIQLQSLGSNPFIVGPAERCASDTLPDTLIIQDAVWSSFNNDTMIVNPDVTTTYTATATNSNNCTYTLTHTITVIPSTTGDTMATVCDSFSWYGNSYTTSGSSIQMLTNSLGCDSVLTLHLTVHPSFDLHFYDTIYDGDHYTFENTVYDTTGVYPHPLVSSLGCDSLRTLHLQRNRRTYNDSVVCQNYLPLVWNNVTFADGQGIRGDHRQTFADSVHLRGLDGIDSLVVMTVTALDTSVYYDILHGCDTLQWLNTVKYTASTSAPFITLANALGCDSVIHLNLTLDSTHRYTDVHQVCDSMRWIDNRWYYADTVGPLDTLVTAHGCDSIVTLDLTTRYASYEESPADTFCYSQTYSWHHFNLHSTDTFATIDYHLIDTLHSIHGCDSVVAIHVTKMAKPHVHLDYDLNCKTRNYVLRVETDAPYFVWSSDPYDTLLDGADWQYDLLVSPQTPTEYLLYADYHQDPLCPVTASLTLQPIEVPDALLRVAPDAFKYNSLEYSAHDMSMDYQERIWYLDGARQAETSRTISGTVDINTDSLVIALSVYNGQCHDTAIRVIPMLKVGVFAPNAFTPNLEQNNRFTLVTHGIISGELFIYNREGLMVYHTTDFENQGWNGGGEPQGNYVWRLDYYAIDYPEIRQSTVGTILLIR